MQKTISDKVNKRFSKVRKILLLGAFGVEGKSFLNFYASYLTNKTLAIYDEKKELLDEINLKEKFSKLEDIDFDNYDLIVRSPGVPKLKIPSTYHGKVVNNMSLFIEFVGSQNIYAVTGTKGKGTTCTIIYKLLSNIYKDVILAGNIGVPVLDQLDSIKENTKIVLEVSSFQAQDFDISPRICVILKTLVDHLDHHITLDEYYRAKANMCKYQLDTDICIYFDDSIGSKKISAESRAEKLAYSMKGEFKGDIVMTYDESNNVVIYKNENIEKIITLESFKLPGSHNIENLMAALLAIKEEWIDFDNAKMIKLLSSLLDFKGLPMHVELVRETRGMKFYNDSFSTTPDNTIAAIQSIDGGIILLLGGHTKVSQDEYKALFDLIAEKKITLKQVILLTKTPEFFEYPLRERDYHQIAHASSMEEAMDIAMAVGQFGDSVLLSPGAASFDLFKNYKERGELFNQAVQNL